MTQAQIDAQAALDAANAAAAAAGSSQVQVVPLGNANGVGGNTYIRPAGFQNNGVMVDRPGRSFVFDASEANGSCNGDYFEDSFVNTTANTVLAVFCGMLKDEGDFSKFALPPNGFDSIGVSDDNGPNFQKLQGFGAFLAVMPAMVKQVQWFSDNRKQAMASPFLGYFTANLDLIQTRILISMCSPCFNDDDSTFSRTIDCPFTLGQNIYFAIPILAQVGADPGNLDVRLIFSGFESTVEITPIGI
jgi:hypothetical protein